MPMIELTVTRGALSEDKLQDLLHKATKTLMWWEKLPDTPEARRISWSFVTEVEPERIFVGGLPPQAPRYRYRVYTIEGLMDDRARQGVMRDLTRLTLEAESAPLDDANKARVWCILHDYPRSHFGVAGTPFPPSGYLSSLSEIQLDRDEAFR